MNKKCYCVIILIIKVSFHLFGQTPEVRLTTYVNPFIGTGAVNEHSLSGSNFPGATTPFGFVQLSPDTRDVPEFPASGYDYNDHLIYGFSHTHLSGTGIGDLFDVLVMPFTGEVNQEKKAAEVYASHFSHKKESASPGYYQVFLSDYQINAELTATEHCGFHRYSFPGNRQSTVLIDLNHSVNKKAQWNPVTIITSQIRIIDNKTIEGYRMLTTWGEGIRKVYFKAEFSKPFKTSLLENDKQYYPRAEAVNGNSTKVYLEFGTMMEDTILMKIGLSSVSAENAKLNLTTEAPEWNFDKVKLQTESKWNAALNSILIDGTDQQKHIFYTALYHTLIQPNNIADVNGDYPANDGSIKNAPDKKHYSTFSLWDTYRAVHPLYTLIQPDRTSQFVSSMLRQYDSYDFLPIWQLWGLENYCMIGNHAVPVVVDAALKNIEGIDPQKVYEAVKGTLTHDHPEFLCTFWDKYGYVPQDITSESVSFTLEMAYDDWCAAQLAKKLNHTGDYEFFMKRSANYKNLFDPKTSFFRAKNREGKWIEPFNPKAYGYDENASYTEGNAWHYLFYVPHDIPGMISLFGGTNVLAAKLDTFFTMKVDPKDKDGNVSGLIGLYAHGNEPSHHVAYLYNYAAQPWKTQQYVAQILYELYNNTSAGYPGNDDCGQISAWYIFSAMGFYPLNPASGIYNIGSPALKQAEIRLSNRRSFKITAPNASRQNIYIQSLKLNGHPYQETTILHNDIIKGGTLEFIMGDKPNKRFGVK